MEKKHKHKSPTTETFWFGESQITIQEMPSWSDMGDYAEITTQVSDASSKTFEKLLERGVLDEIDQKEFREAFERAIGIINNKILQENGKD